MQGPVIPEGPAWLMGIAIAGWVLVSVVRTVASLKRNGHLPPELAMLASEARQHFQAHTSALQAVTLTLTTISERLAHLPAREDLAAAAEKNRHDYRNVLAGVGGEIRQDIRELRDELRERDP